MTPRRDRVGRSRLTGLGSALVFAGIFGVTLVPATNDRQILAIVWAAALVALVLGIAWPLVAVRRVSVTATSPVDARVGDDVPVLVEVAAAGVPCEVRLLDPPSEWHRLGAEDRGVIEHRADRRGVFAAIVVEVRSTAPLGLLDARRAHVVTLPAPVAVAPAPWAVAWQASLAPVEGAAGPSISGPTGGDLVRSVRPYAIGDPAHLVHWPSSARTGAVVVRELEPPTPVGQAIVVDLRDLGDDTEAAASYAFGAAIAVLAAGGDLVLCTAEPEGPVTAAVRSPLQAGRQLARAIDGVPGAPPTGWPIVEIGR